jgi:phosphoenolpyruvate carboxykinase (ATP)
MVTEPVFGLRVPTACGDVDPSLLQPRRAWSDAAAYDRAAAHVAALFAENFAQFGDDVPAEVRAAEVRAAA